MNGHNTLFKLDTGAAVTVLSDNVEWLRSISLTETSHTLRGPGNIRLPVKGQFHATLKYGQTSITEPVYVLHNQTCSLLSRKACVELGLIKRAEKDVEEVNSGPTDFKAEFPSLFTGLGRLKTECHITLRADAKPFCLYNPRKLPHPLLPKVKSQIETMLEQGVISPVTAPTEWCAGIVPVLKPNGKVRICVDLTELNKAVQREVHPMPSVDESLAKLGNSKIFSKLDANSGFWQIPLDEESRLLTTFVTPFGRYCFNRLPFGISSAPEIFQRTLSRILEDLDGTICQMDDILVHGEDQSVHDRRLRAVLHRLQEAGLTLNDKCEFSKSSIRFLAHIIDGSGLHADPLKTSAIAQFPEPSDVNGLQRFMGMVNHLCKFVPRLADLSEPLRQLLRKDSSWVWEEPQQHAFQRIKEALLSSEVLAHYDPDRPTIISADASSTGLGAVLTQVQENGERRPICYASRSLSETEKRYAVIEKEALAVTWASEKFSDYVLGLPFVLETDHKPLTALLNSTELSKMPPRILRFRLRLMRYTYQVQYVPGKHQAAADALSRAPVGTPELADELFAEEVEAFTTQVTASLPATAMRLQEIREAQKVDEECSQVRVYCLQGWPAYMPHQPLLRPYWESRGHLSVVDDLLMYDDRLVIPRGMRLQILDCIHTGHLGITKCRSRARTSVWWPGLSKQIEDLVAQCVTCAKDRPTPKEPLMSASFPSRPWERIATDLFELNGKVYLIVTDYYSRWFEIKELRNETSQVVIQALKELFAIHGIPDLIISDNGPQYSADSFREFATKYGFVHTTSSPRYPQANGEVERAVRTAKSLLRKNDDIHSALLTYRSTPLQNDLSLSELLMGRRLRTQLPIHPNNLYPNVQPKERQTVETKERSYRLNQQLSFNKRHRAVELPTLHPGDHVWVRDQDRHGLILGKTEQPRSYLVDTNKGTLRRNRSALVVTTKHPVTEHSTEDLPSETTTAPNPTLPSPIPPSQQSPQTPRKPTAGQAMLTTPETAPAAESPRGPCTNTLTTPSGRAVRPPERLDL